MLNCIWSSYRDLNSRPLPYQGSALPLSYKSDHLRWWSGRRGSNSRHAAWKAAALPTELLPHIVGNVPLHSKLMVVGEGFEPSKLTRQSYSLLPLTARESHQYHTYCSARSLLHISNSLRWCRHTDSNCGPTDYKSVALPTELCRQRGENYR